MHGRDERQSERPPQPYDNPKVGVPLYVLYRPNEPTPVVTDGVTKDGLLQELAKIPSASSALAEVKAGGAAIAFERWTGMDAPLDAMRRGAGGVH